MIHYRAIMLMESLLRKKAIVLKCIAQGFSGTCDLVSWWLFWEMKCSGRFYYHWSEDYDTYIAISILVAYTYMGSTSCAPKVFTDWQAYILYTLCIGRGRKHSYSTVIDSFGFVKVWLCFWFGNFYSIWNEYGSQTCRALIMALTNPRYHVGCIH